MLIRKERTYTKDRTICTFPVAHYNVQRLCNVRNVPHEGKRLSSAFILQKSHASTHLLDDL